MNVRSMSLWDEGLTAFHTDPHGHSHNDVDRRAPLAE